MTTKRADNDRSNNKRERRKRQSVRMILLISGDAVPEKFDMYVTVWWTEGGNHALKRRQILSIVGLTGYWSKALFLSCFKKCLLFQLQSFQLELKTLCHGF